MHMSIIHSNLFTPSNLAQMKASFNEAKPYKHLVIDDIILPEMAEQIFAAFPKEEVFNKRYKGVNEFKAEGSNFEDFPEVFTQLKEAFHSPEWCKIMSEITGIDALFSVPDALGGGLHQGGNGSFLDIHRRPRSTAGGATRMLLAAADDMQTPKQWPLLAITK